MNSPESIIAATAAVTGIPVAAIIGRRRTRRIVYARFLAIAATRKAYGWWTLQETGEIFHRDHGTIISAMKRHGDLLETEPAYRLMDSQLREDLQAATV